MSNFALQLGTDGKVVFGNNSGLQSAGKIVGTVKLYGLWFKDQSNNAINELLRVWDGTNYKFSLYCTHLFGGSRIAFRNSLWPGDPTVVDLSSVASGLADTGLYTLTFTLDPAAGTRTNATLYDTDGTTVLATGGTNANTTADPLQTGAGVGALTMGDIGDFGSGLSMTVDSLVISDGTSTVFDAEYNEGAGSSTADSAGSTTGSITGTFSWISVEGGTNSVSDDAEFTPFPTSLALPTPERTVVTVFC